MKVTIEGQAYFNGGDGDDASEVPVQVLGPPDEDLQRGQILLVHPKFSIKLDAWELQAALRAFETRR